MWKPEILISVLLICLVHRTEGFGTHDILEISNIAKDIVIVIAKSWRIVDEHMDFGEIPIPLLDRTEQKLFGKIELINSKVDKIAQQIDITGMFLIIQKNIYIFNTLIQFYCVITYKNLNKNEY